MSKTGKNSRSSRRRACFWIDSRPARAGAALRASPLELGWAITHGTHVACVLEGPAFCFLNYVIYIITCASKARTSASPWKRGRDGKRATTAARRSAGLLSRVCVHVLAKSGAALLSSAARSPAVVLALALRRPTRRVIRRRTGTRSPSRRSAATRSCRRRTF